MALSGEYVTCDVAKNVFIILRCQVIEVNLDEPVQERLWEGLSASCAAR